AATVQPSPSPSRRATPSPSASPTPTATATAMPRVPTPTAAPSPGAAPSSPDDGTTPQDGAPEDTVEGEETVDWRPVGPTDTPDQLATMDRGAGESGCGVPWQLLAAIARVESDFGRNMVTSSAGAIGYGQFLPGSWQAFGSEGNAYDYRDALP